MHSPWFDSTFPQPLNFGGIGTLLGHEISHGFDSSGFHFDEIGDRIDQKDVDKETYKKMEERFECFIKQYNDYEVITKLILLKIINSLSDLKLKILQKVNIKIKFKKFSRKN